MAKNYRPASVGMLPAFPGTYLVTAYFDDNHVELVKCNVLGWSVSTERSLTPLVIDLRAADEDPWHVVHPDGRVECADGRCWNDLDSWIATERRRRNDMLGTPYQDPTVELEQEVTIIRSPVPRGMPELDALTLSPPVSVPPPSAPYATAAL
jgi:hypothetical protein